MAEKRKHQEDYLLNTEHEGYKKLKPQLEDAPKSKEEYEQIIQQIQAQPGIRKNIVLFYSSADSPYCIIQNASDRIQAKFHMQVLDQHPEDDPLLRQYRMCIGDEVISHGEFSKIAQAKKELAQSSLENLQKTCLSIYRKISLRDSRKVDIAPKSSCAQASKQATTVYTTGTSGLGYSSNPQPPKCTPFAVGGIGAKMMKQMGWSGGGLGANEQGRLNIVEAYVQVERAGLGKQNIAGEVHKILNDYVQSKDINSIAFSSDFSKEERALIHRIAEKYKLKSKSFGKGEDRILVVSSKFRQWEMVNTLIEMGGENEQYKLILPTNIYNKNMT